MIAFVLTCLLVEITPGPNMATLAALSLAHGRRAGLMAVAGVAAGLAVVGLLAAFGLATLVSTVPGLYEALRWGGAAYLLYLAWDTWRGGGEAEGGDVPDGLFWRGFITNMLNPKAAVFYVAILPGFVDPAGARVLTQTLLLVAIYVTIATLIHALIVLAAARARPVITAGIGMVAVRRGLAIGLALISLWLLWSTAR